MNAIETQKLRDAVEGLALAMLPGFIKAAAALNQISKDVIMNQQAIIEKQIAQALQRQGADCGTANAAARHATSLYQSGSRMGNVNLPQIMKAAGDYAERTQKGFKFSAAKVTR